MNWENVIPGIMVGTAPQTVDPAMDSDQFAAFYERTSRQLWAYLARTSGDAVLADDLMQESYLRFLNVRPLAGGEIAARRYLFRIASNLLRDHWRRPCPLSIEDAPTERLVQDTSAQMESRLSLEPALAALRPRDRQLLWLAHAENYSHREIAEITGLGVTSIRLLLFRARRQMAKQLEKNGKGTI
jgi:RNA polymerase sigma-70 factor (ECF subfamily)